MRKILTTAVFLMATAGVALAQGRAAFPTIEDLKTKCGFDEEQCKKAEPIIADYTPKIKEAAEKAKDAADKKAAYGEIRTMRTEGMNKLKEICKDDEQKKKLDEAFPDKKKKATN